MSEGVGFRVNIQTSGLLAQTPESAGETFQPGVRRRDEEHRRGRRGPTPPWAVSLGGLQGLGLGLLLERSPLFSPN